LRVGHKDKSSEGDVNFVMYMGVDAIDGGLVKLSRELWIEKPDDC